MALAVLLRVQIFQRRLERFDPISGRECSPAESVSATAPSPAQAADGSVAVMD